MAGLLVLLVPVLTQLPANAAGITVENTDRNNRIEIVDARPVDSGSWILYATQPELGQAHQAEPCAVNIYLLKLKPGLGQAQPELLAENYCHRFGMTGRVLADGDVLIIAGERVENWRPGAGKVSDWQMNSLQPLARIGGVADTPEAVQAAVAANGDAVVAYPYSRKRNDTTSPSGMVVRVSSGGKALWAVELDEPGVLLSVLDAWAGDDGGAWLHVSARAMEGSSLPGVETPAGAQIMSQNRLYRIDPKGELAVSTVLATDQMQDFSTPPAAMPDPSQDPEAFQAALQAALSQSEELTQGTFYGYGDVAGHVRPDGGLDLVAGRGHDAEFIRVGADGAVSMGTSLGEAMAAEGLRDWIDFSAANGQLLLYGTLGTRKDRLSQGYLSWIDLGDDSALTRLIPLNPLGLEEAKNAGDEDIQYLENNPGQQGRMMTTLSGQPLTIALVYRSRRQAIQLDEGSDQLLVYTEARDERRAQADKEAKRAQRDAGREKQKAAMNAEMAAAIGVSEEQYAAMSSKERKEAMVRDGDINAMMAAAMKQAEQAQQQMANMPDGMTPEMAAAIAQAQQSAAAAGMAVPDMGSNVQTGNAAAATPGGTTSPVEQTIGADSLVLDSNRHATIEYDHPGGATVSLIITDRETGQELLRKEYADGSIYEYLGFDRYDVPLNRIAIVINDEDGETIREWAPVAAN